MSSRKLLYRLYTIFFIALNLRLFGLSIILVFDALPNMKNKEAYFYWSPQYILIDGVCMLLAMFPITLKRLRYYLRFGIFALYASVDFIVSFVVCIFSILWKNYRVPFLGENMIAFHISIFLSLGFKMVELFITFAIIIENFYTPNCSPEELIKSRRRREVDQRTVPFPYNPNPSPSLDEWVVSPPPYDPPPSYITAINQKMTLPYNPPPPPPPPPPINI